MRTTIPLALAALLAACAEAPRPAVRTPPASLEERPVYPESPRVDQVDVYHGVRVADPYRWLEDLDSARTRAWVTAQNRLTSSYLEKIPRREEIRRRLTELWNFEQYGVPFARGGRYFLAKNDGLQDQSVLYVLDRLDGEPRVLLDPNALSPDGTVALAAYSPSEDGRYMAYGLASGGSDWQEWKVREVATGRDLPDVLRWVKFSQAAWTHDGRGFFYSRYDEPREGRPLAEVHFYHKLYYHRLGTPQAADELVYERPDEKMMGFVGSVSDDGRYLVISVWKDKGIETGIFYRDLAVPGAPVVELLNRFDASYTFVGNDGPRFWIRTDRGAPRGRLVAIDLGRPAPEHWREVLPPAPETLIEVHVVHDSFVAVYLEDAHSLVRRFDLGGRPLGDLPLPGLGTVAGFPGERGDRETFYSFASCTTPETLYRWDLTTGESRVFRAPRVAFDPSLYEVRQVFYRSKDGTRVPMFLTYKKGLRLDGSHPTYLYGYGGFNIPMTPGFSVQDLVWMERGGVYALANLRGGGEYGEDWHQAGTKLRKQNTFDDFIAAAEWLIGNGYTRRERLAIAGHSNGGLLVAAVLNQRPDLFGAAMVGVGVLDLLRFPRFTIGWGWVSDYGSPDDPAEFKALYAYSPYHNLRPGARYPPTLIVTADHDDRVVPVHSFKYAAALQHAQGGDAPVLVRIETRAGHGSGKPVSKLIGEATDELAFLFHALGWP
jgi:prolyl oligopeptidase